MADTVQYFLEEMVPELQQLLKRGIFTEEEVRMIAKERRAHEYRLKSRNVQLADFLRYIEYEQNLNKLRKVRLRMNNVTKKSELAKYSGVKRIHFLFIRALKRFHQHIPLWQQHIRFCVTSGSSRSLNKTFAKVLQLHPLEETFWVQAAFWEYRQNQNVLAARSLLQRAIRTIPNCQWTWLEYARLELLYWKKIKDRLALMGVEAAALMPKKDKAVVVPEEEGSDGEAEEQEQEEEQDQGEDLAPESPFMMGMIPRIVFDRAIAKYPGDYSYYMEFLSLFEEFPGTKALQQHILDALARDFRGNAECQAYLARRPLLGIGQKWSGSEDQCTALEKTEKNFAEAAKDCPSAALFAEFGATYGALAATATTRQLAEELLRKEAAVYQTARQQGFYSEALLVAWVRACMAVHDMAAAAEVATDATGLVPQSALVWEEAIRAQLWLLAEKGAAARKAAMRLFKGAWEGVAADDLVPLWDLYAEVAAATGTKWPSVLKTFRKVLMSGAKDTTAIKRKFLRVAHVNYGIAQARQIFDLACKFPPVGLDMYLAVIEMEQGAKDVNDALLSEIFQRATSDRGCDQCVELWVAYARHAERTGKLYDIQWKARKALRDPTAFDKHFA